MNATIKTRTNVATGNAIDSLSRVSLVSMGGISALIGLWAAASVVGAVMTNGLGQVVRGFFAALVG